VWISHHSGAVLSELALEVHHFFSDNLAEVTQHIHDVGGCYDLHGLGLEDRLQHRHSALIHTHATISGYGRCTKGADRTDVLVLVS
jgi:hypothetical protein